MADRHPSPEELYRARKDPHGAAAEAHLAHAAACTVCAAELARLEAFDHPEPLAPAHLEAAWERFNRLEAGGPPARRAVPPRAILPRRLAFALAATLAACAAGLLLLKPAGPPPPPADATRGAGEQAGPWSPDGSREGPPDAFTFPVTDGAPRRITLYDAAGTYRWTSEPATGGRIPFPAAERARLRSGVDYFWTVLDGEEATAARMFRIQKPGE